MWVVPAELTRALSGIAGAFGVGATAATGATPLVPLDQLAMETSNEVAPNSDGDVPRGVPEDRPTAGPR